MPLPRKDYLQRSPIVIITINVMKQYPICRNDSVMLLVPSFSNAGAEVWTSTRYREGGTSADFGSVEEQLTFLTRSREFLIGFMFFFFFFYSSACNTSPIWFPASDWLSMVFRNCRGKWEAKRAWNSSNSNCFFYQWWGIKLFLRKQAWIFGRLEFEWNPIDFHSHVHKKHMSNLGRR